MTEPLIVAGREARIDASVEPKRDGMFCICSLGYIGFLNHNGRWEVVEKTSDDHYWPTRAAAEAFIRSLSPPSQLECPSCHDAGPRKINTTVKCFLTKERGSAGYGIWAITTETRGVYYHGNGYERVAPAWSVTQLENPAKSDEYFGTHAVAITPEEAIEFLSHWPEAQADIRKIFERHPADTNTCATCAGEGTLPARTETLNGKTPWEFACEWYRLDDICNSVRRRKLLDDSDPSYIPSEIDSIEFAEWLTLQYRLAMAKGIEIGQRSVAPSPPAG